MKTIKLLNADAQNVTGTTSAPVVNIVPELTSEKLTALKADLTTAGAQINAHPVMSKEWNEALANFQKQQKLVDAEVAAIKAAEVAAKVAAARNEKMALVTNYRAAVIADYLLQNDKKAGDAEKAASTEALTKLQESLTDEVLGSLRSKPATTSGTATVTGEGKGHVTRAIRAIFDEIRATNPNATPAEISKECQSRGHARGTSDSAILAYRIEIGEKKA